MHDGACVFVSGWGSCTAGWAGSPFRARRGTFIRFLQLLDPLNPAYLDASFVHHEMLLAPHPPNQQEQERTFQTGGGNLASHASHPPSSPLPLSQEAPPPSPIIMLPFFIAGPKKKKYVVPSPVDLSSSKKNSQDYFFLSFTTSFSSEMMKPSFGVGGRKMEGKTQLCTSSCRPPKKGGKTIICSS